MKRWMIILGLLMSLAIGLMAFVPDDEVELIFSHKMHADRGTECLICHSSVETSTKGVDNNLPDMDVCFNCHDGETASEECEVCHRDEENAVEYPRVEKYQNLFAHKTHIENNIECADCHIGVEKADLATVEHLPKMKSCVECHDSNFIPQDCEKCHEDNFQLRPESHEFSWVSTHRESAEIDQTDCADCHGQDYCQDCHQAENLDGLNHDLNYMFNHSLDARTKEVECMSCHESRTFCVDCHKDHLVMPISHSRVNWSNPIPGDGGSHKSEARLDLESCAACHEAGENEPVCADCHNL